MDTRDNAPLIAAGGGLLLFISLFLSWFGDFSAWELFDLTDIVLALIALLAVAVGVSITTGNTLNVPSGALTTAGLIALGMMATLTFEGDQRKFGLFLGVVGTIGIIVGALGLARGPVAPREPRTRVAEPPPASTPPPPPPPPPSSPGPGV